MSQWCVAPRSPHERSTPRRHLLPPIPNRSVSPSPAHLLTQTAELLARALRLEGKTLVDLARLAGTPIPGRGTHHKGRVGELVERILGATAGSSPRPDFPEIGVELKTIPVDASGRPHESTFVCSVSLADADCAEWETSVVRVKLARVLWVPVTGHPALPAAERRLGRPLLWEPTPEQEGLLRADFEEIMGRIGAGGIEEISAHVGRWLQLRPKARDGSERTLSFGPDGERIATVPRGFYLRARFTRALLADPRAIP